MYKIFSVQPQFSFVGQVKTLKSYNEVFPNTILVDKTGKIVSSMKNHMLDTIRFRIPNNAEEYKQGWEQFRELIKSLKHPPIRLCNTIPSDGAVSNYEKYGWRVRSVDAMFRPLSKDDYLNYHCSVWSKSVSIYGYYYPYFCFEILK